MTSAVWQLQRYPAEHVLDAWATWSAYDHDLQQAYLAKLTPENMRMFVTGPGLETDQVEERYSVPWGIAPLGDERAARWSAGEVDAGLTMPIRNPYVAEALELVVERGYTRFPVCGESIDDIVGVILSKDLLRAHLSDCDDSPVAEFVRSPHFVPESKRAAELMPEMRVQKFHLAIVIDEYGGTAGLVTLEDLIEELVGEIVDEFDEEVPLVMPAANGALFVSARLPVTELEDLLGMDVPEGDWDTLGGLFSGLLGHVPEVGEEIELGSHVVRAEAVDGNRIERLHVTLDAVPQPTETLAES